LVLPLLWMVLSGCKPDLTRSRSEPLQLEDAFVLEAPATSVPERAALYQLLFAGEVGEQAHSLGQRLRILVWLQDMKLTEEQTGQLHELHGRVSAETALAESDLVATGRLEQARYGPIYRDLIEALVENPGAAEPMLAKYAELLAAERLAIETPMAPRERHYVRTSRTMAMSRPFIAGLDTSQRATLSQAMFFLRRRLGPFVNPGDYGLLVGSSWDGNDFGSLRRQMKVDVERHLDLGGLWALSQTMFTAKAKLRGPQLQAVLFMALQEPDLGEALEVMLGTRGPLQFGELPGDAAP
jgi:hypothetical protein